MYKDPCAHGGDTGLAAGGIGPRRAGVRTWRMREPSPVLLTGAGGYVGGALLEGLLAAGHRVRATGRRARERSWPQGVAAVDADAVSGTGLDAALDGCRTAYYLIHSMGAGGGDFAARDRQAAHHFGEAAARAGVERVIYLGGLGHGNSEHLRSRDEVAAILAATVPTVHARAAMVIGPGSASFEIMRHLVRRLPVMLAPRWVETRSQPIALSDVVAALVALAELEDAPAEAHLGGADVLTYREMMLRAAQLMGRRRIIVGVPVLTPRLSSYWVTLVTPVDRGLVRPLIDGLSAEMLVEQSPPPGVNDAPKGFDDAVREALA